MDADLKKSMTEQRILLSGTATKASTATGAPAASITIDDVSGTASTVENTTAYFGVYVDGELYIPNRASTGTTDTKVEFKIENGAILTVNGEVSSNADIATSNAAKIVGTAYSVGTTDEVFYITGFDAAYAAIDTANSKTITVYGDLELTGEYTIAQGQIVELKTIPAYDATNGLTAGVLIAENGAFTIENGGYVNGQFGEIQGVLTVIYGGTTQTEPLMYAVKTTNANNDVIYSGLAYALNNATEGQTVNLVKDTTVSGSLTIPAGVTLDVNDTAKLTVTKNLTVNGTLANHGAVDVKRNVTVAGTVDNTEMGADGFKVCTENASEYDVTVSGTGVVLFASKPDNMGAYNGAAYQDNEEAQYVYTTLSNAVALTSEYDIVPDIEVIGTYSENATVNAAGEILISGTVSVTEIVLDDCTLTIEGTFTGSVTGQSGEDGSDSPERTDPPSPPPSSSARLPESSSPTPTHPTRPTSQSGQQPCPFTTTTTRRPLRSHPSDRTEPRLPESHTRP